YRPSLRCGGGYRILSASPSVLYPKCLEKRSRLWFTPIMARRGRPTEPLVLTELERAELEQIARRSRSARRAAFRAKIVLGCAAGLTSTEVAKKLRTSNQTVGLWRRRFVERRLEGLLDEPRPGRPREINDEHIERVVT